MFKRGVWDYVNYLFKKKIFVFMVFIIIGLVVFEGLFVKGLGVGKNW